MTSGLPAPGRDPETERRCQGSPSELTSCRSPGRPSARWRSTRSWTTLQSGWITTGPKAERFEKDFAAYTGFPHVLALSSATAGLHIGLIALGLKPGDEVITTPMTWAATVNMIEALGGVPVFVDVHRDDAADRPAPARGGGHAAHGRHHPGPLRRRRPATWTSSATVARGKHGCGSSRTPPTGSARRYKGRHVGVRRPPRRVLVPPDQEHDDRRGRRARDPRRRPGAAACGRCASTGSRSRRGTATRRAARPRSRSSCRASSTTSWTCRRRSASTSSPRWTSSTPAAASSRPSTTGCWPRCRRSSRSACPAYDHFHTRHLYVVKVLESAGIDARRLHCRL